ncbi:MAG: hypothetical protein M0P10_03905 [Sphaerochaetaceae bacterium]|nr:hypothetical protein [Sphaerochaetaceae bacterium]
MKYHLKSKKSKLYYSTGIVSKIICILYFVFFSWQIILHLVEGESFSTMWTPIIIALLALVGILYRDYWVFDEEAGKIYKKFGVIPFVSTSVTEIKDVETVEITHFVKGTYSNDPNLKKKGRSYRAQVSFSLKLYDQRRVVVEVIDEKKSGGFTEAAAFNVSQYIGASFFQDRERDMDTDFGLKDLK